MSFISRIFRPRGDDRAHVRPLWHSIVAVAREKPWYAQWGIADTVPGRFDAITLVLCLVLLRMEREEALIEPSVRLTELFVDDMDGQLRESGVGDLVVGKRMGKLMSVLGGRLGAIREAMPRGKAAMAEVVTRNVTLIDDTKAPAVAHEAMIFADRLAAMTAYEILTGNFER